MRLLSRSGFPTSPADCSAKVPSPPRFCPRSSRVSKKKVVPRRGDSQRQSSSRLPAFCPLIVLLGEAGLWIAYFNLPAKHPASFLLELTAIMLPYLLLICLAAQISAIFHALGRFGWPALSPTVLNLVWIVALIGTSGGDWASKTQMRIVCWSILLAGVIQLLLPLFFLRKSGFRFSSATNQDHETVRQIAKTMVPILLGLSVTQLNVLADSLIAWGMSAQEGFAVSDWRPLNAGTASALYLGQRLYQFPIGVFGVALGTVLFPRFARHAEQRQFGLFADDFLDGMKLVIAIGIPAGVGLIVIAHPLAEVLFQRGQFDADDTLQTSYMIMAYGVGVWAFCSLLIVNRAFFALREYSFPLRIGIATVIVNLALNFTLIWPLGGAGPGIGNIVGVCVSGACFHSFDEIATQRTSLVRFDPRTLEVSPGDNIDGPSLRVCS